MKNKKAWYSSKTLWVNFIALWGAVTSHFCGVEIGAEETAGILAFINIILRITTKQPIK
jgi:hypothetical protein